MTIRIRTPLPSDLAPVLDLVPRLRAFGGQSLRENDDLDRAERRALESAFEQLPVGATLLVAIDENTGTVCGVAYAETEIDYFTGEDYGHLAILAVSDAAEGKGVGRALITAVEDWARAQGYRFVNLNVFDGNARARAFYERAGYAPDMIRYAKVIAPPPSQAP
ncbi:MAG: GNAT family N-acetyltransferase [Gemmatimonadota bacterium]